MRIALVIYGDLGVRSGGNLYDAHLVETLRRRGHTVEVVSLPPRGALSGLTHNLPLFARRALTEKLRSGRFDLVLQDELIHASLFAWNRSLMAQLDVPTVGIVHHLKRSELSGLASRLFSAIERHYLKSLHGFVFNSETTRNEVFQLMSEDSPPFAVATPGGDRLQAYRTQKTPCTAENRDSASTPLRLLFVGNVIPRKGVHVLVKALTQASTSDVSLNVVGSLESDARYVSSLKNRIRGSGLEERISFAGPLNDRALARAIEGSDLLVAPSSYEGFGIVLLEAMGFGVPVIASRAGAIPEIIEDDVSGLVVDPADAGALAEVIERCVRNKKLVPRLAQGALERYETFPGWERSMTAAAEFIEAMRSGEDKRSGHEI